MTEFQIFQLVRDAYLSRLEVNARTDIFATARATVVAMELGVEADERRELIRTIRLSYGPMRWR